MLFICFYFIFPLSDFFVLLFFLVNSLLANDEIKEKPKGEIQCFIIIFIIIIFRERKSRELDQLAYLLSYYNEGMSYS